MQDLLAFFLRFGGVFTFVVLEAICALLIVRYNDSQRAIWLHSGNRISGSIAGKVDEWTDFVSLREVADSLAAENARLRLQLLLQPEALPDSVLVDRVDSSYTLVPTRIVRNSVAFANNTLTIDRGSKHKVKPRQGIISSRSVIGVTRSVGTQYSEVLSLLHSESRVSASLVKAGYYGLLRWEGIEPRKMALKEIPRHAKLTVGDSVVTSGYSAIFPKGINIGRVDTFWLEPGSDFYEVRVSLSHDPANLDYGYIVVREPSAERVIFEEQTSNVQ